MCLLVSNVFLHPRPLGNSEENSGFSYDASTGCGDKENETGGQTEVWFT